MTEPGPGIRDFSLENLIIFGSLSISLDSRPESIAPVLPRLPLADVIENGAPNLFAALRWDRGLTPTLRGRDRALQAILDWADDGRKTVSARLISGPGGAGKTRLAAEAAHGLRARRWSAGFLPRGAKSGQIIQAEGTGLLLIIDYPEERMEVIDDLFRHVMEIDEAPLPIRFLLVSRRSFDDWRRHTDLLGGRFGRQELAVPGPMDAAEAIALLKEAAENFAGITAAEVPGRGVEPRRAAGGAFAGSSPAALHGGGGPARGAVGAWRLRAGRGGLDARPRAPRA